MRMKQKTYKINLKKRTKSECGKKVFKENIFFISAKK